MIVRTSCAALLAAAASWGAQAQTFSPAERQILMQPGAIGGQPGTFQPTPRKQGQKPARATQGKGAQPAAVSISSELNSSAPASSPAPALRRAGEGAPQQKPLDQRVPFGPLSLGLQAEAGPRSDRLTTPLPNGINQFKKERADPYVGVSIIDIKR